MIDQVTGSGVVLVAGIVGAALIAWLLPRRRLLAAINNHKQPAWLSTISENWFILVGRYLLAAGVALLLATYLF